MARVYRNAGCGKSTGGRIGLDDRISLNDLSATTRKAVIAERREELASFWPGTRGAQDRTTIKMYPLLHTDKPAYGHVMIRATDDKRLRRVVEAFGKCWRRELAYDFPPFDANFFDYEGRPNPAEVVLFDAQQTMATFPIAAGAAGLSMMRYPTSGLGG
ncbi:hypothetical protein [Streptomyces phaeochromogenes]|uniref:hypothetical protein n=1 Tax=Streptomyces phaeochromogenes TaxID=1923 RepID=UPI002F908540|nr:hypothetical protein OG277_53655 [Streptomyces phaeochromogenes]